ncbi:MAG: PD-(D/E)XK nuclease family protein [Acidobacteriota bacterium]
MSPELHLGRYQDLARAVAERLSASPHQEVIVNSAGLANAITAELLRGREGVAGLRLQTIDAFARRLLNDAGEYPRVAGDAERRLAMRAAVRTIDDPLMESRGMAAMLERSYRDVRDSGMSLDQFDARRPRTKLALRAWREYERLIAQLGAIDPADLLARAAQLALKAKPQIVAGFYDMTGAQLRLIQALPLEAIYVPAGDAPAYAFATPFVKNFSALSTQNSALIHIKAPATTVLQHDNRVEELRSVCADVAGRLAEGVAPRSIGIVARTLEPYDDHLLNRFAAEHGFTTAAEDTTPLGAHRIGRGVATLLSLREDDFPRNAVIELLRDGFQAKRRVKIDEIDAATRRAHVAGGPSDSLRHLAAKPFVDDYLVVVAELETLAPGGAMSGREAAALLRSLSRHFEIETESDGAAADAIDEVAALFSRAAKWRFDIPAILDALEQQQLRAASCELPAVWAGDIMRFRGRSFEHLFAIRMQDELFPQRRVEDPLLPDADRRALGLREIGDGRDEERLLFQLLLDGAATSIQFSFAGSDGFGKVLRKSAFLRDFGAPLAVDRWPLTEPLGQRPTANGERQLQLLAKSGTNSVFDGYLFAEGDDPVVRARLAAALQSVSPTQLEDFGECPQKFLLKHVLGARDIEDPEHELQMNARDKGKVDHGILERFYREVSEDDIERAAEWLPRLEPSLGERIEALVDETYDALERDAPPFNPTMRQIERGATRRILREFLARDLADLHATGLRPKEFEYRCETRLDVGGVSLRVEGWIDRIDTDGAHRYRVVDYKGGKATRHKDLPKKVDRGVRLQLPLYAMAVAQFFGTDDVSGAIKPLVFPEAKPDKFMFHLAGREEALRATLALFAGAILDGHFPAFPADTDKDFNACKYCPVSHSCRTRHDLAEKYAVVRHGDPRTLLGGGS